MWVVWATALCVNLRFMIFSAVWRAYFIVYPLGTRLRLAYFTADLNYVLFMKRFPEPRPAPEQLPYFWGGALFNWMAWQVPSIAGILALLGVGLSLLSDRATGVAGAVAACAAVAAYALPYKLNIVVAIAAAVAMGLLIDHTTQRQAQPLDDRT